MEKMNKKSVIDEFKKLKDEILNAGSFAFYKSGEWFMDLVLKSLNNYFESNTKDFFSAKYPGKSNEFIEKKLVKVAVGNAMIIGGVAGATISAEEFATTLGFSAIWTVPTLLATTITELFLLTRLQLKLIIEIARLYDVELDRNDPEDILTIFSCTLGVMTAEELGKRAMKGGAKMASSAAKKVITKNTTEFLKRLGIKIGVKLLRNTVIKYLVPVVSIAIGAVWNRTSTLGIAKHASKHFKKIKEERSNDKQTV